ncbi:MAG: HDOD domain-containing protein [Acidobacteria bacterium]|nr:HDOD domain-containing protein [Acidobacteriota bacterium]
MKLSKAAICEGLSEKDTVALYGSGQIRQIRDGDQLPAENERAESYWIVLEGQLKVEGAVPLILCAGDCLGPQRYLVRAVAPSTVMEIRATALERMPEKIQAWIHRNVARTNERFVHLLSAEKWNLENKHDLLRSYTRAQVALGQEIIASEFIQGLIRNIPRLPAFTSDIALKLQSETSSVQEVVETIKRDPGMAGMVLRHVNSAQYGFSKKIETFYHACIILGFNKIYEILLHDGIKSAMPLGGDAQKIHSHSTLISSLCYEIACISKEVQPQSATTIGLIHDLGKGVLALLKQQQPAISDIACVLDTARMGGSLARHWQLPDRICRAIEAQHEPRFLPPGEIDESCRKEVAVVYLAHIFEGILTGKPFNRAAQAFVTDYFELLRLSPADIDEFYRLKLLPSLTRNRQRMPAEIRQVLAATTMQ